MNRKITAQLSIFSLFLTLLIVPVFGAEIYNMGRDLPGNSTNQKETELPVEPLPVEYQASVKGTSDTTEVVDPATACIEIQQILENKTTMYTAMKPDLLTKFQTLWVSLSGYVSKAEVLGYDVTILKNDLNEVERLTTDFSNKYDQFLRNLNTTRTSACYQNEIYYVNNFVQTKTSLKSVRDSIRDINAFFTEEVINDLKALEKVEVPNE